MDPQKNKTILPIAILIGLVSVSTASIFIRFAQEEAPSIAIAALRLIFATVLIAPIAIKSNFKEIISLSRKEYCLILFSGFFLALHFASWISSLEYTSIASSVVLVSTGPLWVAILSPLLPQENFKKISFIGIFIAIIGGIVITLGDSNYIQMNSSISFFQSQLNQRSMIGNLLALSGAISVTGYLLIGRFLRVRISLLTYIFMVYGIAALFLSLLMIVTSISPFGYSSITYLWIFLIALVPQVIGHSTYNWALKFLPASLVAILTLGEPIGTTILAMIILGEFPGVIKLVGMILILTGIYFVSRINQKEVTS